MRLLLLPVLLFLYIFARAQKPEPFHVIAYYSGAPEQLDSFAVEQLSHIIFCFGHLEGNKYNIGSARDTAVIRRMVGLKRRNPALKVLLSLGGWGGCATCSEVFSTERSRREFARSVRDINRYFHTDGIDLDWEYPTVEGFPGHRYGAEDKPNFTKLVARLRRTLGKNSTVSFAAVGYQHYLEQAVDWPKVMPLVDFVNIMTYDLVNGYATTTGHHTPLYSTPQQRESTDNAVSYLLRLGVPAEKMIVGGAFYTRIWENVPAANNGLYQSGKFKTAVAFRDFPVELSEKQGFISYWDEVAQAPYWYNSRQGLFVNGDDLRSIHLKTRYVVDKKLGGIMFWELGHDVYKSGLLEEIYTVKTRQ